MLFLVSVEDGLKNVPSVERLFPLPCNKGFLVIWQWVDEHIGGTFDNFLKKESCYKKGISQLTVI